MLENHVLVMSSRSTTQGDTLFWPLCLLRQLCGNLFGLSRNGERITTFFKLSEPAKVKSDYQFIKVLISP